MDKIQIYTYEYKFLKISWLVGYFNFNNYVQQLKIYSMSKHLIQLIVLLSESLFHVLCYGYCAFLFCIHAY